MFLEVVRKKHKTKRQDEEELTDEELYERMSLEGTFGRICCLAYIKEDGTVQKGVLSGDEKDLLTEFWRLATNVHRFIGHNIWDFDLPFIYKRSIINGVKPRYDLSFARYRNLPIYDTLCEWDLWNLGFGRKQSLDALAKALNLPTSKDLMDGSEVWSYYKNGKTQEICDYCFKDVELVRLVYYKMTFEEMP